MKFWEVEPHQHLLSNRQSDEAYLLAKPGEKYLLYFTQGGSVDLNLQGHEGEFRLRWINIDTGEFGEQARITADRTVTIDALSKSPSVAVLVR